MSSLMRASLPQRPTRHRVNATNAPGSTQNLSRPITGPPPAATAHLLLLGCGQAPSLCAHPTICDDHHGSTVDDADHHYSTALPIIYEHHRPSFDHDVVKSSSWDSLPSSRSVHDLRSEITWTLDPTNLSSRYQSAHSAVDRLFHHTFSTIVPKSTLRSLPADINDCHEIMTTAITSAPGTPPELSGSRSTGSTSSYDSSSPGEGIGTDITHYEDISLDDERPTEKPVLRSATSGRPAPSSHSNDGDKPSRPNLSNQIREAVRQHESEMRSSKSNSFAPLRRGHTNPVLPQPDAHPNQRPRSASPPKRLPRVQSTSAMIPSSLRPDWQSTRSSLPLPPRRSSWNPQRKSIQELEAECNDDSDDELPDDASLWNVPVSPHMGAPASSRSSFVGSPTRSPIASPRPIPLDHATSAPEGSLAVKHGSKSLARPRTHPPRSSSANSAKSNPSSPRSRHPRRPDRARSWNLAMGELSEEARIISESLEYHQAERSRNGSLDQEDSISPGSSTTKLAKIQLPPVQKSNLDFMPISKEKAAVLSRTRPSWLPPKDPREEQKHLKEYQRMMAASLEAEKKRQTKQLSNDLDDTTRESLGRIWSYYVEESTNLAELDPRVYDLCWRGIPPKVRGRVWQRGIGNQLGLTSKSYEKALERANQVQSRTSDQLNERERQMNRWFKDIERDAETAFPELHMFQQKGPLWQDLVNVCKAYTCYRSDIGYVYGLQLVAALLLLQLPTPADVFVVLANTLNRGLPLAFQGGDISSTTRTFNHAISTLAIKFPRLHDYLFGSIEQGGLGFSPDQVFGPMLRTLFTNGLDVERLCRVWDLWVFEGDKILVHTAVALVGSLQTQLFAIEGDADLKRRNIQEMLAWGPFNRSNPGEYWKLQHINEAGFVEEISIAGKLDYRGK